MIKNLQLIFVPICVDFEFLRSNNVKFNFFNAAETFKISFINRWKKKRACISLIKTQRDSLILTFCLLFRMGLKFIHSVGNN